MPSSPSCGMPPSSTSTGFGGDGAVPTCSREDTRIERCDDARNAGANAAGRGEDAAYE